MNAKEFPHGYVAALNVESLREEGRMAFHCGIGLYERSMLGTPEEIHEWQRGWIDAMIDASWNQAKKGQAKKIVQEGWCDECNFTGVPCVEILNGTHLICFDCVANAMNLFEAESATVVDLNKCTAPDGDLI
jgi:hypothetical protein